MFNYNGCTCDKCGNEFNSESDVVVCPECGTPHHRDCWNETGHCANQDRHESGFEWQPPKVETGSDSVICPRCQKENPKDLAFCENCGFALRAVPQDDDFSLRGIITNQQQSIAMPILPKALEGETEDVSYKDVAIYTGPAAFYYVFKFKRMDREKESYKPFCWSALFFDAFYFLYRKMWLLGGVILAFSILMSVPSTIVLLAEAGVIAKSSPLFFTGIETVANILSIIMWAIKVLLGFYAIPAYRKKVVKDLKHLKLTSASDNEYYQKIVKKGGISRALLMCVAAFMLFTSFRLLLR